MPDRRTCRRRQPPQQPDEPRQDLLSRYDHGDLKEDLAIDRTPQRVRFATQRDEYLVEVPRATRLASRRFYAVSKDLTKLVAPSSEGFVRHDHTAPKEQFLDVAQAQLKAEVQRTAQLMTSPGKR
jgi:hypothetical protein